MVRDLLLMIALAAAAAPLPAAAQGAIAPAPPYYAMTPGGAAVAPVQQQILENYRSQLLQTQREMLQQNPSGLGREQIEVTRQLNMFNAVPPTSYTAPPPPAPNRVPPTAYSATPPVSDAAPPAPRHAARHPARRRPPAADPAVSR